MLRRYGVLDTFFTRSFLVCYFLISNPAKYKTDGFTSKTPLDPRISNLLELRGFGV